MNLDWLTSPEWAGITRALLHTIWEATVAAVVLGVILKQTQRPAIRYRCALAALAGVILAGLVTWGVISCPRPASANPPAVPVSSSSVTAVASSPGLVSTPAPSASIAPVAVNTNWTPWLALGWMTGAAAMLLRAIAQVAGAGRLRRLSRPLQDERIESILAEARRLSGLSRTVRMAVTDQMTSPAVVGVLMPTLILPLSLVTTLTPEQIRFVLLHELAHIRRGDYLAHLFQLFAEALLFFNPAVWWISRQMRLEREACCDATAIALSGAPADYARTLLRVAESAIHPLPAVAPAFGDRRQPSSLIERVQRLLVPGYQPALRLTWRAMLLAMLTGGGLLFLSAVGARMTVAAILTPEERIKRIETKLAEYGEPSNGLYNFNTENGPRVLVSGTVQTADGLSFPKMIYLNASSAVRNSSYCTVILIRDGTFKDTLPSGTTIYLGIQLAGYAPAFIGPFDGFKTNRLENLKLVLDRGFDVPVQVVDASSGMPLAGATAETMFWLHNAGFPSRQWKSGPDGIITLTHCADLPFTATINLPGYEIVEKRFSDIHPGRTLRVELQPGAHLAGTVRDKVTGQPIAGAEFHLLYQSDPPQGRFEWNDKLHLLGASDENGGFDLRQLRRGMNYYLGVTAPGHESIILSNIVAGADNLNVRLGPPLIVRGRILGDWKSLRYGGGDPQLNAGTTEVYAQNSYGDSQVVPVRASDGSATFEFTNRVAGPVRLNGGDYSEEREVDAPISDWVVDLRKAARKKAAAKRPTREVIFRFKTPTGVSPAGTVSVLIPDNLDPAHATAHYAELQITNSEARTQITVGGNTSVEPNHMVGFWFDRAADNGKYFIISVTNGSGPMVIEIPVVPAGAIYARALNTNNSPAGGMFCGVDVLKPAHGLDKNSALWGQTDGFSDDAPRQWTSGPLPLGGTYQVHSWRGNTFAISQPVHLTESDPTAEVVLHFTAGKTLTGVLLDPDGKPIADAGVKVSFTLNSGSGFGLPPVQTDGQGRFQIEGATPELGDYFADFDQPGLMADHIKLKPGRKPQVIRLSRGRVLGGKIVEARTGYLIPNAEVRAFDQTMKYPSVTVHTDATGCFEFTSLGKGSYKLFIDAGSLLANDDYSADGQTNVVVPIKVYAWSKSKPVPPGRN